MKNHKYEHKKIIISAATVAAFVAAGTIAYCTSEKNHEKDLVQANYEALLDGEGYSGQMCFNEIENVDSQWVLYCGHCDGPVQGRPIPWSTKGTCR